MSKIELLKAIYNRPTDYQAIGEAMKDFIKHCEKPDAPLEAVLSVVRKEIVSERKDTNST
jgi:hypothetical protein